MGILQPVTFCVALDEAWDVDKLGAAIAAQLAKVEKNALPVLVGPEFLCARLDSSRKIAPLAGDNPKKALLEALLGHSRRPALVIPGTVVSTSTKGMQNGATAFFQGEAVNRTYKQKQGTPAEPLSWDKPAVAMADLGLHPDTFLLNYGKSSETRFGIEICTDKGTMRDYLLAQKSKMGNWPEVYIQPSYGMSLSNYVSWNATRRQFQYRRVLGGKLEWASAKYTIDADNNPTVSEFADFALHSMAPGMFIQADGLFTRVGYKHPMQARYTLVPPLESVVVEGARTMLEGMSISVHRFPAVDLNPLEAYWAG